MTRPIYDIRSLKHDYDGRTVLSVEHLSVRPASIVGLGGPNGSGKSTLLRLLGLIEKPAQGYILFGGRPVEPFSAEARFQITLLPQEPFLMKRSVFGNISYGLKLRGERRDVAGRVYEALSLVGLSGSDFSRRPWYALSGGEARRVALAARLALRPKVLLLDEPTANVDTASAELIKVASLKARQELGTTLVVASHDWQWLYEVCDEMLHLFNGRILGTGSENIMFGPWHKLDSGLWGKRMPDKQLVVVSPPPGDESAALIEVSSVTENDSKADEDDVVLRGTVVRLNLERNTGQLFATIIAGNQNFIVGLTARQAGERTVFPGKTVYIHYYPEKMKWI